MSKTPFQVLRTRFKAPCPPAAAELRFRRCSAKLPTLLHISWVFRSAEGLLAEQKNPFRYIIR